MSARPVSIAVAALLLATLAPAAATHDLPAFPVLASAPHAEEGWVAVKVVTPGGFEVRVRVVDAEGARDAFGIAAFDAQGALAHVRVLLRDASDAYYGRGGISYVGQYDTATETAVETFSYGCADCAGTFTFLLWRAGSAAYWEHEVRAPSGSAVLGTTSGDRVLLMHTEDFGATSLDAAPPVGSVGYTAVSEVVEVAAEHGFTGAFAEHSSYWDDDWSGASVRNTRVQLPGGGVAACPGACALSGGAGTYAFETTAVGAGLATMPVFFTAADARLPS